jgi:hypothetical protein
MGLSSTSCVWLWGYKVCYYTGDYDTLYIPADLWDNGLMTKQWKQKVCKDCHLTLPIETFQRYKIKSGDGYTTNCKPCINKRSRQKHQQRKNDPVYRERLLSTARRARERNPRSYIRRRGEWLKYKHNMTLEDYDILLKSQNGVCAICLQECKTKKGLAIDHDHSCCPVDRSCGKCVRGLLCSNCNGAIGMLQEDIVILNRAIAYLTSPPNSAMLDK